MKSENKADHASLWLIPARGGSKGIPGKNIKPFCGESLVGRAVSLALELASVKDTVFVSTDSEEIRDIAVAKGIEIPFLRPPELSSDTASTYSAIIHALKEFNHRGRNFEKVILLQPTSPLRSCDDVKGALALWSPEIDMVVSVTKSAANPYYNLFETDKEGFLKISKGNGEYTRRQDAPPVWEYNGAVYVMSVKALSEGPMSGFKKIIPFEMPLSRSLDLDTPEDWEIAEIIFKRRSS